MAAAVLAFIVVLLPERSEDRGPPAPAPSFPLGCGRRRTPARCPRSKGQARLFPGALQTGHALPPAAAPSGHS